MFSKKSLQSEPQMRMHCHRVLWLLYLHFCCSQGLTCTVGSSCCFTCNKLPVFVRCPEFMTESKCCQLAGSWQICSSLRHSCTYHTHQHLQVLDERHLQDHSIHGNVCFDVTEWVRRQPAAAMLGRIAAARGVPRGWLRYSVKYHSGQTLPSRHR